jgi:hypothetical protein
MQTNLFIFWGDKQGRGGKQILIFLQWPYPQLADIGHQFSGCLSGFDATLSLGDVGQRIGKYGLRLMPELYEYLNPMPYEAAAQMEKDLAEDLRADGYTVAGGT